MEQVLEREAATQERKIYDWRDIEMYYDDGRRITNPDILKSIAEGQKIIAAWEKRIDSYHLENILEDTEYDTEEENN